MFVLFLLAVFSILLIICVVFGVNKENPNHTASMEIIQMLQKMELNNSKGNKTLSEMIEYHKNNPTTKYEI